MEAFLFVAHMHLIYDMDCFLSLTLAVSHARAFLKLGIAHTHIFNFDFDVLHVRAFHFFEFDLNL